MKDVMRTAVPPSAANSGRVENIDYSRVMGRVALQRSVVDASLQEIVRRMPAGRAFRFASLMRADPAFAARAQRIAVEVVFAMALAKAIDPEAGFQGVVDVVGRVPLDGFSGLLVEFADVATATELRVIRDAEARGDMSALDAALVLVDAAVAIGRIESLRARWGLARVSGVADAVQ